MSRLLFIALLCGAGWLASPTAAAASEVWWGDRASACPNGARLKGAPPPKGTDVGCKKRSGVWHGRRTVWFDRCDGHGPCPKRRLPVRYEGAYRRGIEHGHWVWWHQNGQKGLEGEFFAGKKVGTWHSWDRDGNERLSEFPPPPEVTVSVDNAILAALEEAKAAGKEDLARELEDASSDLRRNQSAEPIGPSAGRGHEQGQSIGARATIESSAGDLADQEMGSDDFGEESNYETTPYVRRAVKRASRVVNGCYRKARKKNRKLSGEITVHFDIERDGSVVDVSIVRSTVTQGMGACIKRGLSRLKLAAHDSPTAIEVITPWTFRAGR